MNRRDWLGSSYEAKRESLGPSLGKKKKKLEAIRIGDVGRGRPLLKS